MNDIDGKPLHHGNLVSSDLGICLIYLRKFPNKPEGLCWELHSGLTNRGGTNRHKITEGHINRWNVKLILEAYRLVHSIDIKK